MFYYYHGIDTYERHEDISAMFEAPADNQDLFEEYGVHYVFIGSAERSNFDIDYSYFMDQGTVLYDQDGIKIIELP